MGLHTWGGAVCRNGVHKLSRNDSGKTAGNMAEGYGYAKTVIVPSKLCVLPDGGYKEVLGLLLPHIVLQ